MPDVLFDVRDRLAQLQRVVGLRLEEVEGHALGGAPPDSGQLCELLYQSLNRLGMEKGSAFLREVVKRRALMLPLYRRKLRRIATMILEGKEVPILE